VFLYRANAMPCPVASPPAQDDQPARRAAASMTARPRGSDNWASRYATGSRPAAAASSSMNDSAANTLRNAPSDRSADTRSGISSSRWFTTR
jgi:hypothetical protein